MALLEGHQVRPCPSLRPGCVCEEWCDFSDVGDTFGGVALTLDAYEEVEREYVSAVRGFALASGHSVLQLTDVEREDQLEGVVLDLDGIEGAARRILRNDLWFRMQSPARDFYVHFGYDYYMYIGSRSSSCPEAITSAVAGGLYVEPDFPSPYLELVEVTLMDNPVPSEVERLMVAVARDLATSGAGVLAHHQDGTFSQSFRCLGPSAEVVYEAVRETLYGFEAGDGSYVYLEGGGREVRHSLS